MTRCRLSRSIRLGLAALATVLGVWAAPARAQYGIAVSGVGPINRSMGGAAVAAPIDSGGALYWNPATIGALGRSEIGFGIGILIPRTSLTSSAPAGTFGPTALKGTTGGNNGVFLLPMISLVYNPKDSPWSFGIGVFEIGGFGVNYPVSQSNPILNPAAPFGSGAGPLYSQLQLFQFSPTAALKVTDRLYLGVQANIDYGILNLNPELTAVPSLVQSRLGTPVPSYPYGTQGRARGGGGFQLGVYYEANEAWSFGAALKSPQWFDTYRYNALNPTNGHAATPQVNVDFPLTGSVGVGYKGIENLLLATDLRIFDYRDTNGFRHGGFDNQTGALRGVGWQNVFAIGSGAQYQWTDALTTRIGYTFGLNPIGPALTTYNLGSPTIIQHSIAIGGSYNVTKALKLSLTYAHDFQNSITGPIVEPFVGKIPNSSVRTAATADSVYFGASVAF